MTAPEREEMDRSAGAFKDEFVAKSHFGRYDTERERDTEHPPEPCPEVRAVYLGDRRVGSADRQEFRRKLAPVILELFPAASKNDLPNLPGGHDVRLREGGISPDVVPVPVAVYDPRGPSAGDPLGGPSKGPARHGGQHRIENECLAPQVYDRRIAQARSGRFGNGRMDPRTHPFKGKMRTGPSGRHGSLIDFGPLDLSPTPGTSRFAEIVGPSDPPSGGEGSEIASHDRTGF